MSKRSPQPRPPDDPALRLEEIRAEAWRLGFDALGVAALDGHWPEGEGLAGFLAEGREGQMTWLKDTFERRRHPRALWSEARVALALAVNYGPEVNPLETPPEPGVGVISCYAQGEDYHDLIKKRLKALGRWMAERYGGDLKVFVDTAPLMEKPVAARAGLGWQGRHTNLVSRDFGSWLFLGVILTTLDLPASEPVKDHCGSCRACVDICPTKALTPDGRIDARACISYLTIEHRGPVPEAYRAALGARIYGCDDCLAVCPWNKFAQASQEMAFQPRLRPEAFDLARLSALDDAAFRAFFAKSPVKRIGRDRFVRNVLYAIGNSGRADLAPVVAARLDDADPAVADAAAWAALRLGG